MESNHNEIEEIVTQKKVYEVLVYPSNSRDQNKLTKPEDSYAVVTFIETVNLFYNYKVNLVFGRYQEMPTKFPAITICNQNPFNE